MLRYAAQIPLQDGRTRCPPQLTATQGGVPPHFGGHLGLGGGFLKLNHLPDFPSAHLPPSLLCHQCPSKNTPGPPPASGLRLRDPTLEDNPSEAPLCAEWAGGKWLEGPGQSPGRTD